MAAKLFCASSLEPKSKLNRNLVGRIGISCRSKIVKIVSIGNPRWPQSYFALLSEPKGQLTRKLVGSIGATSRSKLTKIVPIEFILLFIS